MEVDILFEILLSLALGALIGIERERRAKGEIFAGVRTFMFVSLFGYLTAFLTKIFESMVTVYIGLASIVSFAILNHFLTYKKIRRIGVTTEMAFIVAYLIGIFVFFDSFPYLLPVSLGIITTLILFSREAAHKFAKHLTKKELRDALIFAIVAFIILPMLPNYPVDPWGIFNLYLIWLAMVLVLGLSFVAYIAMKILGAIKGLTLAGFFGGITSSTSITVAMAQKIKENEHLLLHATFAMILACSTMFLRVILVASIFNLEIGLMVLLPLLTIGLLGIFLSYLYWLKIGKIKKKGLVNIGSPLSIKTAVQFTLIFAIIFAVTRIATKFFSLEAIYLISFFSGLPEVDAITISLSTLLINPKIIVKGIILASIANTIFKLSIFWFLAGKDAGKKAAKILLPLVGLGLFFVFL